MLTTPPYSNLCSLSCSLRGGLPIMQAKVALGQWQGISLFEHRHAAMTRRVLLHALGEQK